MADLVNRRPLGLNLVIWFFVLCCDALAPMKEEQECRRWLDPAKGVWDKS